MDLLKSERVTLKGIIDNSSLPDSSSLAILGISPFSSRFTYENISAVVEWASTQYSNFKLFIPDLPTTYSLLSMGYSDTEAHKKMKKQCRYLKNKCERAISEYDRHIVKHERIITYTLLNENCIFKQKLQLVLHTYNNNKFFKSICEEFSRGFLSKNNITPSNKAIFWSTQYILYEMPIFLYSKEIFNFNDAFFVYPNCPSFLRKMLTEQKVMELDSEQEFLEYKIWR